MCDNNFQIPVIQIRSDKYRLGVYNVTWCIILYYFIIVHMILIYSNATQCITVQLWYATTWEQPSSELPPTKDVGKWMCCYYQNDPNARSQGEQFLGLSWYKIRTCSLPVHMVLYRIDENRDPWLLDFFIGGAFLVQNQDLQPTSPYGAIQNRDPWLQDLLFGVSFCLPCLLVPVQNRNI